MTVKMNVTGLHVLVIGTERPWLEALILEAGARKVTTLGNLFQMPEKQCHCYLKKVNKLNGLCNCGFIAIFFDGSRNHNFVQDFSLE